MRGHSEPPDKLINTKTGLRKGFPIKISGYAMGADNNNITLPSNNANELNCDTFVRLRTR